MNETQQILAEVKKLSKDTATTSQAVVSKVWDGMPEKLRDVSLWTSFFIALYYFSSIVIEYWFSLLDIAKKAVCFADNVWCYIIEIFLFLFAVVFFLVACGSAFFLLKQLFTNPKNKNAQYNLGVKYHEGIGVEQNYAKAIEYYTEAGPTRSCRSPIQSCCDV